MRPQPGQVSQTFGSWSNASRETQNCPCRQRGGLWKLQQAVMLLICNFTFVSRLILQCLMQKIALLQDKSVLLLKNRIDFTAHPGLWYGSEKRNAVIDQSFHSTHFRILCGNDRNLCAQRPQSDSRQDVLSLRLCDATELKKKKSICSLCLKKWRIISPLAQIYCTLQLILSI